MCRLTVAEKAGILFRSPGVGSQRLGQGEWLVRHPSEQDCQEAALLGEIKSMQPQRSQPAQRADFSKIAQGYYATASKTGNNDLDFWFVRVEETGRWRGYRFVRRYIGGRGPQRIGKSEQMAALHAILEATPEAAGDKFADELGKCRDCGRDLTDDESRARKRGPVCAGK